MSKIDDGVYTDDERLAYYFKDDVERWMNVTVIGSQFEQQTSTRGNWRHRRFIQNNTDGQRAVGEWINGRAPDMR